MEDLVSVIVPIYNVEKYLGECLDSIINQTHKNLEIMLVDDGSPDNCPKICDEYAKRDNRIKVIHKQNGGVSSARNVGLDSANGDFVVFVDSDDFVKLDYIEKLLQKQKETNADMVFCGYLQFNEVKLTKSEKNFSNDEIIVQRNDTFYKLVTRLLMFRNNFIGSVWRVLFRKKLLSNIRFNSKITIMEDLVFTLNCIVTAMKISFLDEELYFYRQISTSALHKYRKNYLANQMEIYKEFNILSNEINDVKITHLFQKRYGDMAFSLICNERENNPGNYKIAIKQIKECELYKYYKIRNIVGFYSIKTTVVAVLHYFTFKLNLG